jgi:hypothetical protein
MFATEIDPRDLIDAGPLDGETLIALPAAARSLGKHVNHLRRWEKRGAHGVRLETVQIGGRVFTSAEALRRFSAAVRRASRPVSERAKAPKATASRERTDAERRAAAKRATAELARRKRARQAVRS